jgi:hypothetical protein
MRQINSDSLPHLTECMRLLAAKRFYTVWEFDGRLHGAKQ